MIDENIGNVSISIEGFFPRRNPRDTRFTDPGECSIITCSECGSHEFAWVSIEYCPSCGYFADYWDHGNTEVEDLFNTFNYKAMKRIYLKAVVEKLLSSAGVSTEDYTLNIGIVE